MATSTERSQALASLPTLHAVALRLSDAGANDHTIAVAVGVDDDQVKTFLTIANQKLARLEADLPGQI